MHGDLGVSAGGGRAWRTLAATLALLAGLLAGGLAQAPAARAAGIVVNSALDTTGNGAICTLRDAIDAANSDAARGGCPAGSGADTITFAPGLAGPIELTAGQLSITSDLAITGPGAGALTVRRSAAGGTPAFRVFNVGGGTVAISGLTISGGSADYGGGLIISGGALTLTSVVVSGNAASVFGGGLAAVGGSATLVASTVRDNSGGEGGGGMLAAFSAVLTVVRSTVTGNEATAVGAGLVLTGSVMNVANSTISGNRERNNSGALYIQDAGSSLTLTNSTVAGNTVFGEAGLQLNYNVNGTIAATNTIVGDTPMAGNCANTITDGGHNLDSGSSCGFGTAGGSRSNTDPRLGPLADNGGPTQTRAPLPFSPAIDAGDDAACAAAPIGGADQRGVARPVGARCDIGAYEVAPANPAPALTGLAPASAPAGGANFTLTVDGTGFIAGGGSVVRLNGTDLATTYVSPTRLTAAVPAALVATAGTYPVVVVNSPPGGGTFNARDFVVVAPATLAAVGGSATYGDTTATLVATLTGPGGAPLAYRPVAFTLNGQPVGTATTGADGVARLPGVPIGALPAGNQRNAVCATFAGDSTYLPTGPSCGPLRIARRTLVVQPRPQRRTSTQANAGCTSINDVQVYNQAGNALVNGDTLATAIAPGPGFGCTYTMPNGTPARPTRPGTYDIALANVQSQNYDIRYKIGVLTVTP